GDQLIPIHPANTPDTLVTRAADAPAKEDVMLSPVQAGPSIGAGPVDKLPVIVRLCALHPGRMNPGVAHQPCPPVTFQPSGAPPPVLTQNGSRIPSVAAVVLPGSK